jgi:hypothetical protein
MTAPLPANDNGPLGHIYSLEEAAAYLRTTKQAVARTARRFGLCSIFGRDLRFSDSDVLAIWDAMRCRSSSSSAKAATTGTSAVQSEDKAYLSLVARATEKRQKRSGSRKKLAS